MKFNILTLFPEMFPGSLAFSLAGEALKKGLWQYEAINLKQFGAGKFPRVDDTPYGGGAGMVMRADVLEKAIEQLPTADRQLPTLIYMSPRGARLTQCKAAQLSKSTEINILCGRYEGIDERVIEHYGIEELSIGDYILSGGEPAALILMDALIRLIPGAIGNAETHNDESFSNNLLEYPHYTRPAEWKGLKVPEILTGGNHAKIAEWRRAKALEITKVRRPDLLK